MWHPRSPSNLLIESISDSRGTPRRVVFPSAIRHAAMIGSELFLLPLISTLPLRRFPPLRTRLSIWPYPWPRGPKWSAHAKHCTGNFRSIGQSIGRRSIDLPDQLMPGLSVENHFSRNGYRPEQEAFCLSNWQFQEEHQSELKNSIWEAGFAPILRCPAPVISDRNTRHLSLYL